MKYIYIDMANCILVNSVYIFKENLDDGKSKKQNKDIHFISEIFRNV